MVNDQAPAAHYQLPAFRFRLSTLFIAVAIVAICFGLTPRWHQAVLNSWHPYYVEDKEKPYYLTIGNVIYADYTWRFAGFFAVATWGLAGAICGHRRVGARLYLLTFALPFAILPYPFHSMTHSMIFIGAQLYWYCTLVVGGPVITVILTHKYWVDRRFRYLGGLPPLLFQLIWHAHLWSWYWDLLTTYGD